MTPKEKARKKVGEYLKSERKALDKHIDLLRKKAKSGKQLHQDELRFLMKYGAQFGTKKGNSQ